MAEASSGVFYSGRAADRTQVGTDGPRQVPEDTLPTDGPPDRRAQLIRLLQLMQRGNARKQLQMHMTNLRGEKHDTLPQVQGTLSGGDFGSEGR